MLRILASALAFGASAAAAAAEGGTEESPASPPRAFRPVEDRLNLNIHVYGFSYHTDRQGVRRTGLNNEVNFGLGLNYTLKEDERGIQFVEAGLYKDSGSNWAKIAGIGYQYKLYQHWRLGGALLAVHSRTYNKGNAFIAPLPILTYDFGALKLNAIYVPRYGDYNQFAVFGFYFSVPLAK